MANVPNQPSFLAGRQASRVGMATLGFSARHDLEAVVSENPVFRELQPDVWQRQSLNECIGLLATVDLHAAVQCQRPASWLSGNSKSLQERDERSAILFGQIQSKGMTFDRIALGP